MCEDVLVVLGFKPGAGPVVGRRLRLHLKWNYGGAIRKRGRLGKGQRRIPAISTDLAM